MRIIEKKEILEKLEPAIISACYELSEDVKAKLREAYDNEKSEKGRSVLSKIIKNYEIASEGIFPICQDTGAAVVFADIGVDCHINGNLNDIIVEAVANAYTKGYMRASMVRDPFDRVNTKNNTPAFIYYDFVDGDRLTINVAPKGFGSENKSRMKMFTPSSDKNEIVDFIVDTAKIAGSSACPPFVLGVGIGGTFDKCAVIAKKALIRPLSKKNSIEFYANLENEIYNKINDLGIGPLGFGGLTTCLSVNIEVLPTHIAGLPIAVNMSCHATRHKLVVI